MMAVAAAERPTLREKVQDPSWKFWGAGWSHANAVRSASQLVGFCGEGKAVVVQLDYRWCIYYRRELA